MSTQPNDGGPAFPRTATETDAKGFHPGYTGMTLRDWFAGQALAGVMLAPGQLGQEAQNNANKAASWAYQQADAMLKERER